MPRQKMTDEERAAKKQARKDEINAEREAAKTELRGIITELASQIPLHVRMGGVQTVHEWKSALDKAVDCTKLGRVSVERLKSVADALRSQVVR
ncbi:hypothetical protein G3N59_10475 [Paraburkholderia sp. Ac-20340]|uniref:hypothetical protein n=1 Tax=Paraburkholderia sp. Ac-20340 TaxID=2703888 RepID=UPI0019801C46|nr:hypothetical protein [Paraburkholderia sp. Ac-20340]MBN3853805.1 hypothetical protein [Paraburkholderia sp. Ac-20340]